MPTFLGQSFKPEWRGKPPHMLKADWPVWWRFLDKYSQLFDRIYYDVLVGGPYYTKEQLKDPYLWDHYYLCSKRLDALAETKTDLWLIEVTREPGLRAMGQLLSYKTLWQDDPKIAKPLLVCLVCEIPDEDLFSVIARQGVQVYTV